MQTKALVLQVLCFTSVEFHRCSKETMVLTEISVLRGAWKFMSHFLWLILFAFVERVRQMYICKLDGNELSLQTMSSVYDCLNLHM